MATPPGPAPALVATVDQDKVVLEVRQTAAAIRHRAEQLVITPRTRADASAFLVQINTLKKRAEDRRKAILDPHTRYAKRVNDLFRDLVAPVVEADRILRDKLRDFVRREEAEQAEAQAAARREQLRLEALAQEAAKAEAAGETTVAAQLLEEAVRVEQEAQQLQTFAQAAEPVERTVRTDVGTVGTKRVWTFAVTDLAAVPEEYLKPREVDGKKVREAIAAGLRDAEGQPAIPGIRIYEDDQVAVRG